MKNIVPLMKKAEHSALALWWFNRVMGRAVPFNHVHGFSVTALQAQKVCVSAKHQRCNLNHIRGIHACAIATIGEYAAGLLLMRQFTPRDFRLIMASLDVQYHYQAKQNIVATAELNLDEVQALKATLVDEDRLMKAMVTRIEDVAGNHVATVTTHWQIKSWQRVQTKA